MRHQTDADAGVATFFGYDFGTFQTSLGAVIYANYGGNVGVGTADPLFKLDVRSTFSAGDGPLVTSGPNNNTIFYDNALGAEPHTAYGLFRKDSSATTLATTHEAITLYNKNGGDNTFVKLTFVSNEDTSIYSNPVAIGGVAVEKYTGLQGNWARGNLYLWVKNNSTTVSPFMVQYDGKIGINNTSPSYDFDVTGFLRTSKSLWSNSYSWGTLAASPNSITLNLSNAHYMVMPDSAGVSLSLTDATDGAAYQIAIYITNNTRSLGWSSSSYTLKWPGGVVPDITANSNGSVMVVGIRCIGSVLYLCPSYDFY